MVTNKYNQERFYGQSGEGSQEIMDSCYQIGVKNVVGVYSKPCKMYR